MKKIAIWGPNRWCNFGDDLQSVVFALHIRSLGYEPVVFMLDQAIAKEHALQVANTVDELLKGALLCVIAGGALLTPASPPKQILLSMRRRYARDIFELHLAAKRYDVRVCAISMGGDGKTRNRWFWYDLPRNLFFQSKYFIDGTVRLEGDVAQMRSFGKQFKYIPDCLFSIKRFIDTSVASTKNNKGPIRIGFNFRERHIPKSFLEAIHNYAAIHSDMEFYFATTHMDKAIERFNTTYEYLPQEDTHNLKFTHYETPRQLLQFVADMDVFVASKLHLGLLGLLIGTPFLSYRGMGKAKTFLRSIGGDTAILDDEVTFESLVAPGGLLRKPKKELMKLYDLDLLQKMVDESWKQFEFCTEVVNAYAEKSLS
jgi:hypothetical protein